MLKSSSFSQRAWRIYGQYELITYLTPFLRVMCCYYGWRHGGEIRRLSCVILVTFEVPKDSLEKVHLGVVVESIVIALRVHEKCTRESYIEGLSGLLKTDMKAAVSQSEGRNG